MHIVQCFAIRVKGLGKFGCALVWGQNISGSRRLSLSARETVAQQQAGDGLMRPGSDVPSVASTFGVAQDIASSAAD